MRNILANMEEYVSLFSLPNVGVNDVIDVVIVSIIIFEVIRWIRNTRAWTLFKGLMVLVVFTIIATVLQLHTIMWILERCRAVWGAVPYDVLTGEALAAEPFRSIINPDDASFANPPDMIEAIQTFCRRHRQPVPDTRGRLVRCIFESLALRYRHVFDSLRTLSGRQLSVLHVIGGGSCNALLNQWTANATGVTVVAGPAEATAIGNILVQAIAAGEIKDRSEILID